mgnify:CR=1 FL=1
MKITAAVVHERSGPFTVEQLDLCDPRERRTASSKSSPAACARPTLHGRDAYYPTKFPKGVRPRGRRHRTLP